MIFFAISSDVFYDTYLFKHDKKILEVPYRVVSNEKID